MFRKSKTRFVDQPFRRRVLVYVRRIVIACLVIVVLHRAPVEYGLWKIQSVGGTVSLYSAHSWLAPRAKAFLPESVLNSQSFSRLFWPRVGSVDLRAVPGNLDTQQAIAGAATFPSLRYLTLYRSGVTNRDVEFIAESFPALVQLDLNETAIDDVAISHLKGLANLRQLNIQRTSISDAAVEDLLAIPALKELLIGDTDIQPASVARLRSRVQKVRDRFVTKSRCKKCSRVMSYCRCEVPENMSGEHPGE